MRDAVQADLPGIVAIYNSTIPGRLATADTTPVSVESKREWFNHHTPDRRPILVHETDGQIVGWVSFEPFYGRPAYDHTAEISIYIAEEARAQGLGTALLREAIELCPRLDISTLVAYIFSHNEPSLRLFRSLGFEDWGQLPDVAEMDGARYSLTILGLQSQAR